ncbi:PA domain-containing protein [Streptomyces regalis]|uniref:PA domain-containing protein n=1 Tax=Streptomyces regalis TaxID=68262 RepID=UPI000A7C412C|nr:PA domain-containing protein [Streptomyces regalis]
MRSRRRQAAAGLAVIASLVAAGLTGVARAHDGVGSTDGAIDNAQATHDHDQHGGSDGHLPASSDDVRLVSKLRLDSVEGKIADVGVYKGYAYLASWGGVGCDNTGVHVVDIRNPGKPKKAAFIPTTGSAPGEGIQTVHISTPAFTGDILVTNNEICGDGGVGGMNIYDVTDPTNPKQLANGVGDFTLGDETTELAREIHSAFAWDAGDKAYAVLVDNEEGTDVDIMDITDPTKATLVAEYDLDETFPQIVQAAPANLTEIFLHDMVVKNIRGRQIMVASYWDAGYVLLDVTDPKRAKYIGDTDFTDPDPEAAESGLTVAPEGNGHQAEFTLDNRYVIGADEDFAPYALSARNVTDGSAITAGQGIPLTPGTTLTGGSVYVGRACSGDAAVPAGDPAAVDIAIVERGVCSFTEKVAAVEAAGGYDGILVFNRTGSDACDAQTGMSVEGTLPTFGVAPRGQGFAIFDQPYSKADCLAGTGPQTLPVAVGTKGDQLTFSSHFDGWGYAHLYRNERGKMTELDTYAIPEAHDPAYASGFGDLSIHEVATSQVSSDLAYISYYAGGFRVTKIKNNKLVEVGHYIDKGGNNFWGVQTFDHAGKEYVAASDRDYGLYIFQYTGRQ